MRSPINNHFSANHPSPRLIYVVDDEAPLLEVTVVLLEAEGYQVKSFTRSTELLEDFARTKTKPELLITDFQIANDLNGMELVGRCKQIWPSFKAILMSGTVDRSIVDEFDVIADDFIPKPFTCDIFLDTVSRVLGICQNQSSSAPCPLDSES